MEKTKSHFIAVYDAVANNPILSGGVLYASANPDFKIAMEDIVKSSLSAYEAGTSQREDVTVAAPTVGDVLVITLQRVTSRQVERKSFRHYVVAGDTANSIADDFRAQINDFGSGYSAAGASPDVDITLDEGQFTITVSAGLSVVSGAAWVQAVGTPELVEADGGVAASPEYDVWTIYHYADVVSSTFKKTSERTLAVSRIYTEQTTVTGAFQGANQLEDILDGTYTTVADYFDTGYGIA